MHDVVPYLMLSKLTSDLLLRGLHVFAQAHHPVLHDLLNSLQHCM